MSDKNDTMKKTVLLLLFICIRPLSAQVCFNPNSPHFGIGHLYCICSADFNKDGKLDLAAGEAGGDNVEISLATGPGSFGAPTLFTAGSMPISITTADFNGDANIDIATANFNSSDVSILLGDGTGSFSSPINFGVDVYPTCIISADFNNDGNVDLAVTTEASNDVSVFLGTGTGSFGIKTNFPAGTPALPLTFADFNEDGNIDIAAANSNNVSVLLGTGTGSFSTALNYTTTCAQTIETADFNTDGHADLVTTCDLTLGGYVSILLGNGTGGFGSETNFNVDHPSEVTCADFNGDGYIDLATNNSNNYISVLNGTGTGSFTLVLTLLIPYLSTTDIINGDFNGDSKIDLVIACENSNAISILLNCITVLGIENLSEKQQTSIFPNPTSDEFIIEANTTEQLTIDLYDLNGRHVFTKSVSDKSSISVTDLKEGIYTLTVKTVDRVINKKLAIIH